MVLTQLPPLLLELWREQHPEGHEQTVLNFKARKSVTTVGTLESIDEVLD